MSPIPDNNRQDPRDPEGEDLGMAAMDTNVIIAGSSSDGSAAEDEDLGYLGYQAIPQEPTDMEDDEEDEDSMEMEASGAVGGSYDNSPLDRALKQTIDSDDARHIPSQAAADRKIEEIEERKSMWSEVRVQPQQPMDQDHIDKIKSAMNGFTLPGCQVPSWAKVMSEQDWKKQILSQLHRQHGRVPLIHSSSDNQQISADPSPQQSPTTDSTPANRLVGHSEEAESDSANRLVGHSEEAESEPANKHVGYTERPEQEEDEGANVVAATQKTDGDEKATENR